MATRSNLNHESLAVLNRSATGHLFYATVTNVDPASYHIMVAPQGNDQMHRMQARQLSSILCGSLGFKLSYLPTVGSVVFCYSSSPSECLILGMVPGADYGEITPFSTRTVIGAGDGLKAEAHRLNYEDDLGKTTISNLRRPTDLLQGELAISNEFGVLLGLFQQFATLKASELAQVQCFVLDDLVRIISHNFQHFHSMGQFSISHDGDSLTMEAGLTHDPKEAMGIPQGDGQAQIRPTLRHEAVSTSDDSQDYYTAANGETAEAVERLKLFVGHLGDFVNLMLVAPSNELRALDGVVPDSFDRGLLQVKANLDGLFVLRSVKGVVIEKTNWIRVPHRIRSNEDPLGDDAAALKPDPHLDYEFDNQYRADGQPFLYYLQLRDYLSYIQEGRGYRHFEDRKQDFVVNDDVEQEQPLDQIYFVDPTTGTTFLKRTSHVVLMPNGGVSLRDAWSSAINMEGGNIYIQPARDLVLQPGRHLVGKVGGCVTMAARQDIDLSTTQGGVRVKSETSQYLYSRSGGIVLHTDAQAVSSPGYFPLPESEEALRQISGVV